MNSGNRDVVRESFGPSPYCNLPSPDSTYWSTNLSESLPPLAGILQPSGHDQRHRDHSQPSRLGAQLGRFVPVDAGATDSLVMRSYIKAIGMEPADQRVYGTADGREIALDFAFARTEFMGDVTAGRIIISDAGADLLLGVTALEFTSIKGDPVNQRLKRLPALQLKRVARGRAGTVILGTRACCPHHPGTAFPLRARCPRS